MLSHQFSQHLVLGLNLLFQELDPLLFPLMVRPALTLKGGGAILEELFLPTVEHRGLQSMLLTQIRNRHFIQQVPPQNGNLLLRSVVLSLFSHVVLSVILPEERSLHFQLRQDSLKRDLEKLQARREKGQLQEEKKIHQAIGRLKERYPRVARYYRMDYDAERKTLRWEENSEKKAIAEKLDGGYVLKTDRQDLTAEEIWRTYMLLTRVEGAFRAMKSPLLERPIFHHLEHRTQTHIFLCVLAYHLLVAIEKRFLDRGVHTSWATLRGQLRTHEVITVVLPTREGRVLKIRKSSIPEPIHKEIYSTLRIPVEIMRPVKTWHDLPANIVTE